MDTERAVRADLKRMANAEKAEVLGRFFKTGKGEYAEGDRFLGVVVPEQRKVAKKHRSLPLEDAIRLLRSEFHEHRLTAIFILILRYEAGAEDERESIFQLLVAHLQHVNNWDLVDAAAPKIGGPHLVAHREHRKKLDEWAQSSRMWTRRWAMMCTLAFIRQNQFSPTMRLAKTLLRDDHDLIHKAVGWMLREVGKRDLDVEEQFLTRHAATMPRTMLRYAIEKMPPKKRQEYLSYGRK